MSVHNDGDALRETIDSVLAQEGVLFEFIVVNDGSTDGTLRILELYADADPRLHIIDQENQGLTKALIQGCAVAQGRYIARQDCGDVSRPGRLKLQAKLLDENTDCVFVSCWTVTVGPKGEHLSTAKGTGLATKPTNILSEKATWGVLDGPSHHTSVMFRKEAYLAAGGYRAAFYFGQDWDLWYRLAERGTFCMIEQILCEARVTPSSISTYWKPTQNRFANLSRSALRLRQAGYSDESAIKKANRIKLPTYRAGAGRRYRARGLYFIGRSLEKNYDSRSRDYLLESIKANPFFVRGWMAFIAATLFR